MAEEENRERVREAGAVFVECLSFRDWLAARIYERRAGAHRAHVQGLTVDNSGALRDEARESIRAAEILIEELVDADFERENGG